MKRIGFFSVFLFTTCLTPKSLSSGVYHYVNSNEKGPFISTTIRFNRHSTFIMFGVRRYVNSRQDTSYGRYVTFGDWNQKGDYVVLNTNLSYKEKKIGVLVESDMRFLNIKPWDLSEGVIKIEQDSFLVIDKSQSIFSVRRNILLSRQ